MKSKLFLFLTPLFLALSIHAAPPLISYSGQVSVDGQPYTGTGLFKFAFVDTNGQFSYWSQDGTSSAGSEPTGQVSVPVNTGLYSVMLGDTALTGMSAIAESIFANHNDVHLRIWFSDGQGFEQLTPDRRFASVPYSLGANGTSTANLVSTGSGSSGVNNDANATPVLGNPNYNFGGPLGEGFARLVANGPDQPSDTLILLEGDSAQIVTYFADQPGRLQYAFGEHTFVMPKSDELIPTQNTLVGAGSVRLSAPTGSKNLAVLKVSRASGRNPTKFGGGTTAGSGGTALPTIVSIPTTRAISAGATESLIVSASGEDLSIQWKKNGVNMAGATSPALNLNNVTQAEAGQYLAVVTNEHGSVTSDPVTVTVQTPVVPTGVYRINNSSGATGHEVALTSYAIDAHEITKGLWDKIRTWALANGYAFGNEGKGHAPEHPVHSINWYDCVKWANALSEHDGLTPCYYTDDNCIQVYRSGEIDLTNYKVKWTANGYRLPTEAEWESAARGLLIGSKYSWGETSSTDKANFDQSLIGGTSPVKSYPANGYEIHDIGGNLREWIWDWRDERTYEYDFNETFTDANGSMGLVNELNSSAFYDTLSNSFDSVDTSYSNDDSIISSNSTEVKTFYNLDGTDYRVKKTIPAKGAFVTEVTNEIRPEYPNNGHYRIGVKMRFQYVDGTFEDSSEQRSETSGYVAKSYTNPQPQKKVLSVEVMLRRWDIHNEDKEGFERNTILKGRNMGNDTRHITIDLPKYKENDTYFRTEVDAFYHGNDDIWFELVDESNATKTYANADFDKLLPIESPIVKPKKLRIYMRRDTGWTALHAVYWTTNDPKSWNTGTQRVVRDNHYAENLQTLSTRNFETPATANATTGFRLVRRP
jgi:formylglycine-generating enzyme required for sulfatase activity